MNPFSLENSVRLHNHRFTRANLTSIHLENQIFKLESHQVLTPKLTNKMS